MGIPHENMTHAKRIHLAIVAIAIASSAGSCSSGSHEKIPGEHGNASTGTKNGAARMKAQKEIERLRDGGEFLGDITAFTAPDADAIEQLGAELRSSPSPKTREEVVNAMVRLATATDPEGLLTNRQILASLFEDGAIAADCAYMRAMDEIAKSAPPEALAEFRPTLARLAGRTPVSGLFLVIAKAKAVQALPALQARKGDPVWSKDESFRIALAALGDKDAEHAFIERFRKTQDAKEKMEFAKPLGQIGTRSTLEALAQEIRSPLVFRIPAAYESSVRPEIAKAIQYNYPRNKSLLVIRSDSDYEKIEEFCEKEFGTRWSDPRPPYLNVRPIAPPR